MTPLTSVSYYSTLQTKIFKAALALLFFCMNSAAYAIFQGSAGEALLVPLVLYDANTSTNTTISVTVPSRIGESLIPNEYTAPHTSPSDTNLPDTDVKIHWTFFNQYGVVMQDGYFLTMPNSIYILDWKSIAPGQKGIPGYMLLQTEAGFHGEVADFNIFADAKFSMGSESTNIPVFPLADGTDATEPVGNCFIEGENEACTYTLFNPTSNPTHNFVSPLSSGIKTGGHANVTGETSFDLMPGRRTGTLSPLGLFVRGFEPTLSLYGMTKIATAMGRGMFMQ